MALQEASGWCRHCQQQRLIRRPGTNHVLHLLLAVITFGIWIPIWVLCSIRLGGWRCSSCGQRVSRNIELGEVVMVGIVVAIGLFAAFRLRVYCADKPAPTPVRTVANQKRQDVTMTQKATVTRVRQQPPPPAPTWVSATQPARRGAVSLRILSVRIGPVPPPRSGQRWRDDVFAARPHLLVTIEIKNHDSTKKVEYWTFGEWHRWITRAFVGLRDNFGNDYDDVNCEPDGRVARASIYPDHLITDLLVFEPPIDSAEYLDLTLPLAHVGETGSVTFRIRTTWIER